MKVNGKSYRTVWYENGCVCLIDQRKLPFEFEILRLQTVGQVAAAISDMAVRGAPAIGAAAAYALVLAAAEHGTRNYQHEALGAAAQILKSTRPTAVNLGWAVDAICKACDTAATDSDLASYALKAAEELAHQEVERCRKIGEHGLSVLRSCRKTPSSGPVRIMTHCNAGWLACVDHGTATAPIYLAHDQGIPLHIWVSETRPRNQGARLTAWELAEHGVPFSVLPDNAAGLLIATEQVDMVIVGADRVTRCGDTANKVGTYLKALAAREHGVPFYVALPSSTIDWEISDGFKEIPIEQRNQAEVTHYPACVAGNLTECALMREDVAAVNPAFDITPARLISGFITERGVCPASPQGLLTLFPEQAK